MPTRPDPRRALRVHQWLPEWDKADFDREAGRRRPEPYFYILSVPGRELRRLSGIYRRDAAPGTARALDSGIQRRHDPDRSAEIGEYLRKGFPWSSLSKAKRSSGDFEDMIKPGWLPTGIVVNILQADDTRRGDAVHADDLLNMEEDPAEPGSAKLHYPRSYQGAGWEPTGIPPLEVIDGQHRLWAFSDDDPSLADFELPVIAFNGLDTGWQAYLFYTINIKPKRINASLAFDLYPLLRTAEWLNRAEEHHVYKETRAQELVEALWSYPESPWYDRIDMLGDRKLKAVSQSAWIRSLTSSVIKSYRGRGVTIGGLFGGESGDREPALAWGRAQQAAFLIFAWQEIARAVSLDTSPWSQALREAVDFAMPPGAHQLAAADLRDPAFTGSETLLNGDQGVRAYLQVVNDLCMTMVDSLRLQEWTIEDVSAEPTETSIHDAVESLRGIPLGSFLTSIAVAASTYDWRTSSGPGLTALEQQAKMRFRGGSGYRELRNELLLHIATHAAGPTSDAATDVSERLAN